MTAVDDRPTLAAQPARPIWKDGLTMHEYCAAHRAEWERPDVQPFVNDDGVIQFPGTHAADYVQTVMHDKRAARRALIRSMNQDDAEALYQVAVEGAYIDPWNALLSLDDETLTWVLHRAAEEAAEFRRTHAAEISQLIAEASYNA
jgi:hypothetical protein